MKILMSTDIVYKATKARETVELEFEVVNGALRRIALKNDNIKRDAFYFECIEIPPFYLGNNKANQIHTIGSNVFRAYNSGDAIFIHKDKPINIGNHTFPIKKLILPESVTTVELEAFAYAVIDTVVWSKYCKVIPEKCFMYADIIDIEGIEDVEDIKSGAFYNSSIPSFHWPERAKNIPEICFSSCQKLESITGIENVETVERAAFHNCGFKKFVWPEHCTTIPEQCFKFCLSLTEFIFNGMTIKIEDNAFNKTNVQKLDLSNAMTAETYEGIENDIPEIVYPFYN
jgi:hypothetical protein